MSLRDQFPGYYRPTHAELKTMWESAIFVFDTNVLLHIYRYSPTTREELFDSWNFVRDRIWIPYQVAREFQENRLSVVAERRDRYRLCRNLLDQWVKEAESQLKKEFDVKAKKDPNPMSLKSMWHEVLNFIDFERLKDDYKKALDYLDEREKAHELPDEYGQADVLRDKLDEIFGNNIGRLSENAESQIELAKKRITAKIPPGYMDVGEKDVSRDFNDAVVWLQILEFAAEQRKPIVLVTSEVKEDWCWKIDKETMWGARPELVEEMQRVAGVKFALCNPTQFIKEIANLRTVKEHLEEQERLAREKEIESALAETQAIQDEEDEVFSFLLEDEQESDEVTNFLEKGVVSDVSYPGGVVGLTSAANPHLIRNPISNAGVISAGVADAIRRRPLGVLDATAINPLASMRANFLSAHAANSPAYVSGLTAGALAASMRSPLNTTGLATGALAASMRSPVNITGLTTGALAASMRNPLGITAASVAAMNRNPLGVRPTDLATVNRNTIGVHGLTAAGLAAMNRNHLGITAAGLATMNRNRVGTTPYDAPTDDED